MIVMKRLTVRYVANRLTTYDQYVQLTSRYSWLLPHAGGSTLTAQQSPPMFPNLRKPWLLFYTREALYNTGVAHVGPQLPDVVINNSAKA